MSTNPNKLSQLWHELKRRRVIHVIIVYATAAFVIIELVGNVYESLQLPDWTPTLVILLIVIGFPFAIIFSWIYDVTLKGIKKTEPVKHTKKKKEDTPPPAKKSWFENSIAVLPFQDMSPEKDQEYFCDGITEELINALTHVESLKVIARTSSFAFKGKPKDMREIGRKLDVETLLEGSIRKDGKRLRITAQLIKVADGSHLWSEKFDREIEDVFAIQDEISLAIVDHLKVKLLGEEKAVIVTRHTENLEAYNLYLKGNHHCHAATASGFEKAIECFEQALQKDARYALPYIGLAEVYWLSTFFGNMPPNEAYPQSEKFVNKALGISNILAEAHSVMGLINTFYYWNWKKAELSFKQAIQLNPNSAYIHIYYSFLLTCTRRHKEAIKEAKRAQELDPLSSYITSYVGSAYYYGSQFDRAIEECQMVIAIDPNYYIAHQWLSLAYTENAIIKESLGEHEKAVVEFEKAIEEMEKAVDLSDDVPFMVSCLACTYYIMGKKDHAEKLIDNLKKRSRKEYIQPICFYTFHQVRGEQDLALEWLERACTEHDSFLPWFRFVPNDATRIPDEPRYHALMKKYGLEN
jgi:TolB-like protein/Tfp pilus assembly protein PilF